jgi:hypothetical protein
MSLYPKSVARCEHIKVNGTQCGSPALLNQPYCYFHAMGRRKGKDAISYRDELDSVMQPGFEDANAVQVGIAGVMWQLAHRQIDHKTAALMLYGLQTAAVNVKRTSFEPDPTLVVIDPESVKKRPIGTSAWSTVEGREYDDLKKADLAQDVSAKDRVDPEEAERGRKFMAHYKHLTDGLARDPEFLDKRVSRQDREAISSSAGIAPRPTAEKLSGG